MDEYDEDEQDPPVAFEQDPESDDIGDGYFVYADGRREYSSDYDTAMELGRQGKAKGVDVISGRAPEPEPLGVPQEEPLPPEPTAKAPEEEPEPVDVEVPARAPAPALVAPGAPSRALPLSGQSRRVDTQDTQSRTAQGGSSSSVQRTGSAVPMERYQQAQQSIGGAYDRAIQGADDARFQEAAAIANRAEQIQQIARDREAAAAAAIAQRNERAMAVKQRIQEVAKRPTDNNAIWKEKGILGTLAGALGVFLGGLSAYTMGRENTALKTIQQQKQQNIDSQLQDRDSELRGLERELGSLDAAIPVFEARMNDALRMRLESMLQDERSQTALANGRKLIQQLELEKATKLAEGERAFYGTIAQQQAQHAGASTTVGTTTGTSEGETRTARAGGGGPNFERALKLDKMLEEQGYDREQRAKMLASAGLPPPTGETAEEFSRRAKGEEAGGKYTEPEAKAQAAHEAVSRFAQSAGLVRNPKTGQWEVGEGLVPPGFVESINPFDDNNIKADFDAAVEAFGRFQSGGVIGDEEREAFREQLGEDTGNRRQLAARMNAAEAAIRARRPRTERDKPGGAPEDWR